MVTRLDEDTDLRRRGRDRAAGAGSLPALLTAAALLSACGGGDASRGEAPCAGGGCVVAISANRAYEHACALLEGGRVTCWGSNLQGQLGSESPVPAGAGSSLEPVTVASVEGASAVAAGEWNGCAVSGGAVSCWGENSEGALGAATPPFQAAPRRIQDLSGATAVSVGRLHACALLGDGGVRCWGYNQHGQLGDGTTTTPRHDPVAVGSVTDATAVGAGSSHTCAIVGGGRVRCWGYNIAGQLGNRSVPALTVLALSADPVEVTGVTGARALAVGSSFSCALLQGGSVACWGDNAGGRLGAATADSYYNPDPVTVASVAGATAIAAGSYHACAIVAGGAVKCWGSNQYGQLGNGSTRGAAPLLGGWYAEDVVGVAGATQLTAGNLHTCALVAGRGVKCWGRNAGGQLGDGTTTDRHAPVDVRF